MAGRLLRWSRSKDESHQTVAADANLDTVGVRLGVKPAIRCVCGQRSLETLTDQGVTCPVPATQ